MFKYPIIAYFNFLLSAFFGIKNLYFLNKKYPVLTHIQESFLSNQLGSKHL